MCKHKLPTSSTKHENMKSLPTMQKRRHVSYERVACGSSESSADSHEGKSSSHQRKNGPWPGVLSTASPRPYVQNCSKRRQRGTELLMPKQNTSFGLCLNAFRKRSVI